MSFIDSNGMVHEISDFNNQWNKRTLELARQERSTRFDELIEMSYGGIRDLKEIGKVRFDDFYQSRIVGIVARNRVDYSFKRAIIALKKPLHYLNFRIAQSLRFD